MHSRIFQISTQPIDKIDYIDVERYYEWFVGRIADYVVESNRDEDIRNLKRVLNGVAKFDGDKFTIVNKVKWFEAKFVRFAEALNEILHATFGDFCKGFDGKMFELENAYTDEYDVYIDDNEEDRGLIPLDEFMRTVKDGDVFYFGETFDYHW